MLRFRRSQTLKAGFRGEAGQLAGARRPRAQLYVEQLEDRNMLSANPFPDPFA